MGNVLKNITLFKGIVLGSFVLAVVVGMFVFSFFAGVGGEQEVTLRIVGTLDERLFNKALDASPVSSRSSRFNVLYRKIPSDEFDIKILELLAGRGAPDMILVPQDKLLTNRSRLVPVSYDDYSKKQYQETFPDIANVFTSDEGLYGFPLIVDPMVMYYNRTLFNQAGIAQIPQTWSEFNSERLRRLIQRNGTTINKSMVAFGRYKNVTHAKDIMATLLFQVDNPLVSFNATGNPQSSLVSQNGSINNSTNSAIRFYTQFAKPNTAIYSWNGSLPPSRQTFLSSDLAIYFAPASEQHDIAQQNPNLNFGVSVMPQRTEDNKHTAFADIKVLALTQRVRNYSAAVAVGKALTEPESVQILADGQKLPPVRRDLLANPPVNNAFMTTLYEAVLSARTWLDPNPSETDIIFQKMIEDIQSGRESIKSALRIAHVRLGQVLAN